MKRELWMIVFGFALCLGGADAKAEEKPAKQKPDAYSAVIVGTRGAVGGRTMTIDMRIKEYTSDETVKQLLGILSEGGPDALRRAMEKLDVGQVSPTGSVGTPISLARIRNTERGTLISLVTARRLSFLELYQGGRSTDYQFGIIQMLVNEKGKGEGSAIGAALIKFDKEGTLIIESYGQMDTLRLSNVRKY
jgi:hypothetical protein